MHNFFVKQTKKIICDNLMHRRPVQQQEARSHDKEL